MCVMALMEVRRQLCVISFQILLLCGFPIVNFIYRLFQQVALPSHRPLGLFFGTESIVAQATF